MERDKLETGMSAWKAGLEVGLAQGRREGREKAAREYRRPEWRKLFFLCFACSFVGCLAALFAFYFAIQSMTDPKLYYTPPSDEAFEDMRRACIELWETYDDPRYVAEKTERIKVIHNVGDNFMYMFAMLDMYNQRKVAHVLAPETIEALRARMIDGGNHYYIVDELLGI